MSEIWKDIKGYEGQYQVSNIGRVKSVDRLDASGHHRKEKYSGQHLIKIHTINMVCVKMGK